MLCAESRKEMEDWISALKSVQKWETYEVSAFLSSHSPFNIFTYLLSDLLIIDTHEHTQLSVLKISALFTLRKL